MTRSTRLNGQKAHRNSAALRNKSGELGEDLSEIASLAVDVGRDQLGKIRDAAVQKYEDKKKYLANWEESLEAYICERPIKSLLVAAGIGMVVSMVWRRR